MTMKPIESVDAKRAYEENKPVFVLNRYTGELIHLNKVVNKGFIVNVFAQDYYFYYVYGQEDK